MKTKNNSPQNIHIYTHPKSNYLPTTSPIDECALGGIVGETPAFYIPHIPCDIPLSVYKIMAKFNKYSPKTYGPQTGSKILRTSPTVPTIVSFVTCLSARVTPVSTTAPKASDSIIHK